MNHKLLSAAIVALAGTSAALAAPRETFDAVALNGGPMIANHTIAGNAAGSAPSNSVTSFAATGGYAARAVRVVGTVGSWGAGTYGSETVVRVTAPSGEFVDFRPSSLNATPAGDVAFDLQANLVPATTTGTWTVMTYETLDDGSVDSTYSALSVTIDDANTPPPPFHGPLHRPG